MNHITSEEWKRCTICQIRYKFKHSQCSVWTNCPQCKSKKTLKKFHSEKILRQVKQNISKSEKNKINSLDNVQYIYIYKILI